MKFIKSFNSRTQIKISKLKILGLGIMFFALVLGKVFSILSKRNVITAFIKKRINLIRYYESKYILINGLVQGLFFSFIFLSITTAIIILFFNKSKNEVIGDLIFSSMGGFIVGFVKGWIIKPSETSDSWLHSELKK